MKAENRLTSSPIEVLKVICTDGSGSPLWIQWSEACLGAIQAPDRLLTARVVYGHCELIDSIRVEFSLKDIRLTNAAVLDLADDVAGQSRVRKSLGSRDLHDFRDVLERRFEGIDASEASKLGVLARNLQSELRAVSSSGIAVVARQMANDLDDFVRLVDRSTVLEVWLPPPTLLGEVQQRIITYGIVLQRQGLGRIAKLCAAVAFAIAGVAFPPLGIGAAVGSIALVAAEVMNEERFFALKALKSTTD